ncbi:MAG: L,D-transpeptidase family protein, partial [Actinomycetota bacterium]|nr:L,D-transpeptidase family protein [Actinomycetota bacterium]
MKKRTVGALFALLLLGTCGLAYGVGQASGQFQARERPQVRLVQQTATPTPTPPPSSTSTPRTTIQPTPQPKPTMTAGPRMLGPGDQGATVRELQARLKQIAWYFPDITGSYGTVTSSAVRGFQAKRKLPVTGVVDRRTMTRLYAMTRTPTSNELQNLKNPVSSTASTHARLDPLCTTGRAMCIDKRSRTVRWVVDGRTKATYDVRFGASYTPTREGLF